MSEPRCELSDLPESMCAHCKSKSSGGMDTDKPSTDKEVFGDVRISTLFRAMYSNDTGCAICEYPIEEDDLVGFIGNDLCCVNCVSSAKKLKKEQLAGEVAKFSKRWGDRNV